MTKEEKAILSYFVDEMESKGYTRQTVLVSFTDDVVQTINDKHSTTISGDTLDVSIKKLLASEHLTQKCMSGCKNSNLQITSKGVAVVTSLRAKEAQLKNRSWDKKVSDYIENRKGLFILLGSLGTIAGIITLILRLKGNL